MLKLLIKTVGVGFYEQHTGLFLVLGYLLFGAVDGSQLINYHYAILIAICSSPIVGLAVSLTWLTYAIKCYLFVKQRLSRPEFTFSVEITKMTKPVQLKVWFILYLFLLTPVLVYATFILYVSLANHYVFSFFATLTTLLALLSTLSLLTFKSNNFNYDQTEKWTINTGIEITKPFWSWPLFQAYHEQPLLLFACKLVSLIAFKCVLWVFADVGNDIRVFLTAMLAAVLSHAMLIFYWVRFDATYLSFVRSLKISKFKRLSNWLITLLILIIPELGLFAWIVAFNLVQVGVAILFSVAMLFALFTIAYVVRVDMEHYMKCLLVFFFGTMLAILSGYYVVFSMGTYLIAALIFLNYYLKIDLKELV
ncbi:MAG: hypothetical protein ACQUHE_00910 [Bacteroidia bacterium]